MRLLRRLGRDNTGGALIELLIAIAGIGVATFIFLHGSAGSDGVMDALGGKWEQEKNIILNQWTR